MCVCVCACLRENSIISFIHILNVCADARVCVYVCKVCVCVVEDSVCVCACVCSVEESVCVGVGV